MLRVSIMRKLFSIGGRVYAPYTWVSQQMEHEGPLLGSLGQSKQHVVLVHEVSYWPWDTRPRF